MNTVGEREINTQGRVVTFFQDVLGYKYLGNRQERADNSNIEKTLLTDWIRGRGYDDNIIKKVLSRLEREAVISSNRTLPQANREVYGLLRYGRKGSTRYRRATHHCSAHRLGKPAQQ